MSDVQIYTDGLCPDGTGLGGWSAIMMAQGKTRELFAGEQGTTANRMELQACIEALNSLKRPCLVEIFSDSTYVIDGATKWIEGWKSKGWRNSSREPIKNEDLWQQLDAIMATHDTRWTWVKASSHEMNVRANFLAHQGYLSILDQANAVHQEQAVQTQEEKSAHDFPEALSTVRHLVIHTDGSCLGNPGPGGWAAIIQGAGITTEISGGAENTTNNRMELFAALEAIESVDAPVIKLVTDSKYVIDGIGSWMANWKENKWRTKDNKPVKNADLWRRMDMAIVGVKLEMEWVKGHSGHPLNERADALAQAEAKKIKALATAPSI